MTRSLLSALALLSLSATACSSAPKDTKVSGHRHHEGEHGHGKHKHAMPAGPVKDFHDAFAPIWHMDPGMERTTKGCDSATALDALAAAVGKEAPPAGADSVAFIASTKHLATEVTALGEACKVEARPEVDTRLHEVHEAFHDVLRHYEGG